MKKNRRLVACLMILLILMVATSPALADDYNYTKEEVEEIENYILELEKELKLKNELIESLRKEKELLQKKNDNLNIIINENKEQRKKDMLKSFGGGFALGVGTTALLIVLN